MALSNEECDELERLEIVFRHNLGRGAEEAERIDFLRAKATHPTVAQLIAELCEVENPEGTFVVLTDDDVVAPMEYIACDGLLADLARNS